MLSPIGNSYGYYTSSPYATGHTAAAAHTALINSNHDASLEVQAVTDVPEVFSNEETERVERTPAQQARDRMDAYELMTSLNPRNAEHLNAPLEFMTRKPFDPADAYTDRPKRSIDVTVQDTIIDNLKRPNFFHSANSRRNGYVAHLNAYNSYTNNNKGFYAMA
jgi:hypothetical protein